MTAGSSADTTWTFSGEVAALAAGESTADDTVVQSVDSSAEDEAKASSSATKVAPKASNIHRFEDGKGMMQAIGITRKPRTRR